MEGTLAEGEAFKCHPRFRSGHHGERRMVTSGSNRGPRSTVRLWVTTPARRNS